jgi:hypothetical protein
MKIKAVILRGYGFCASYGAYRCSGIEERVTKKVDLGAVPVGHKVAIYV